MTAKKEPLEQPRKFTGEEMVVATHNKGKVAELRELFGPLVQKLHLATDFGLDAPEETGTTFVENATIKALFVAKATGKVAIADDSGLCVDALDGAPGVYTADWAELPGGGRDFYMAMGKVNAEMEKMDRPPTGAHYVSCLAIAWPDGHTEVVEGYAYGDVVWPPRGDKGFGFDPVFLPKDGKETYGEMNPTVKNDTNHRADAFRKRLARCF